MEQNDEKKSLNKSPPHVTDLWGGWVFIFKDLFQALILASNGEHSLYWGTIVVEMEGTHGQGSEAEINHGSLGLELSLHMGYSISKCAARTSCSVIFLTPGLSY